MWFLISLLAAAQPAPEADKVLIDGSLLEICGAPAQPSPQAARPLASDVAPIGLRALQDLPEVTEHWSASLLSSGDRASKLVVGQRGGSELKLDLEVHAEGDEVALEVKVEAAFQSWTAMRRASLSQPDGRYTAISLMEATCDSGEASTWVLLLRAQAVGADGDLAAATAQRALERARYDAAIDQAGGRRARLAVRRSLVAVSDLGFVLPR